VVMTRATRGGTPRRAQARPTLTCRPVCLKFCSTWRLRERLSSNCCHCGLTKRLVWTSAFSSDCLSKTAIRCAPNHYLTRCANLHVFFYRAFRCWTGFAATEKCSYLTMSRLVIHTCWLSNCKKNTIILLPTLW
jgi:hypothetical protein